MIYVVDLESIPTRYTCEWKWYVPQMLTEAGLDVTVIEGDTEIPEMTTPGAFLNFGGTNMYKATQVHTISKLFVEGQIKDGDQFLFTDSWHPGVLNLKYMAELLNVKIKIHGLWHAGSYDPNDFLGRLIGNKTWIRSAERSFFDCFDYNWVATTAHERLIKETFPDVKLKWTGWPMSYTYDMIKKVAEQESIQRENIIIFPHRLAPEKRVDLFKELSLRPELSHYEFVIPMELGIDKHEYHKLLLRSKFAVSFAEQETLGISMYEAACAGVIPLVPDRLSYIEMYYPGFKQATSIDSVVKTILDYETKDFTREVEDQAKVLHKTFFTATKLIEKIKANDAKSKSRK
jgi:hypothetical protein